MSRHDGGEGPRTGTDGVAAPAAPGRAPAPAARPARADRAARPAGRHPAAAHARRASGAPSSRRSGARRTWRSTRSGSLRERARTGRPLRPGGSRARQRGLAARDIEAAGTPILLVHGMVDNRAIFTVLKRGLRRRGFGRVVTINYSPVTNDIRQAARDLAAEVEALIAQTGLRADPRRRPQPGRAHRALLRAAARRRRARRTPWSRWASRTRAPSPPGCCRCTCAGSCGPAATSTPSSTEPAPTCRTRFVAYWSDLDQMILPHGNARLEHPDLYVRNVRVHGVGHMSLPLDGQVVHEISAVLSQLDWDGTTLSAGVTPLLEETAVPRRRLPRPLSAT